MNARDLGAELARALREREPSGRPVVLAWSGGLDSTALLDLMVNDDRVRSVIGTPIAAHLDHAMRPESADDASALGRTAAAWGVDYRTHRLATAPRSEEEARTARYAWLHEVATDVGAEEIWTAHHADDQIETVLFRILRGTGVHGLSGIPARRDRVHRPLLTLDEPVHRADLSAHATARGLPIRIDATNEEPVATRNRLRNEVLPLLDELVPGAGDAILRLSRNAERTASELDALVARALAEDGLAAESWTRADRPLRRALLRGAARRMGVSLSEAATLAALDLPPDAQSGRGVDLPGHLRFERDFDRWRLVRTPSRGGTGGPGRSGSLEISMRSSASAPDGSGALDLGGRALRAVWRLSPAATPVGSGAAADPTAVGGVTLDLREDHFPLTLRAWGEGDRITLSFGTTSVAKAWSESKVPRRERPRRWVLTDRHGTLLAAEGLGSARPDPTIEGLRIRLQLRLDVDA